MGGRAGDVAREPAPGTPGHPRPAHAVPRGRQPAAPPAALRLRVRTAGRAAVLRGQVQLRPDRPEHGRLRMGAGSRSRRSASSRMLRAVGVDPRDVLYSNTVKPAAHVARCLRGRCVAIRHRLRGRARQDRSLRPRQRRLHPGQGRRLRQRLPAVTQVRRRGPPRARPPAAGAAPGAAAVRFDVPRRLAVRRDLGLGPGHVIGRPAHAPARQRRHRARDARHRRGLPGAVRRTGAVHRGDRRRGDPLDQRALPYRPASWQPSRAAIWSPRPP